MGSTRRYSGSRRTQGKVKSLPPNASDISNLHQCEEAIRFRKAAANAMQDNSRGCKYGCSRLPCIHGASVRFPSVGGSLPRAEEPSRNERVFVPFVYAKPTARRLREYADCQASASSAGITAALVGKRAETPNAERADRADLSTAPTAPRSISANVERVTGISSTVANAEIDRAAPLAVLSE